MAVNQYDDPRERGRNPYNPYDTTERDLATRYYSTRDTTYQDQTKSTSRPGGGGGFPGGAGGGGAATTGATVANNYSTYLELAGLLGKYLTNRQQGKANAAASEAEFEARKNSAFNKNEYDKAYLDLARRKYSDEARPGQARSAALGDVMANVQDVNISAPPWVKSHVPNITGGLRPSLLGPNAREAGRSLSQQSLERLKSGNTFTDPQFKDNALPDPGSSTASNIGSILALASALGQTYGQNKNNRPPNQSYADQFSY